VSDEITFERVNEDGVVVERIVTYPGSHSETEYGVLALEGRGGWQYAPEEPTTAAEPKEPAPSPPGGKKEGGEDGVRDDRRTGRVPGPNPRAK
jgi:hypothetical protein